MIKRFLLLCTICLLAHTCYAIHIKGGHINYKYLKPTANDSTKSDYEIVVTFFRDCSIQGPMPTSVGIYDAVTNALVQTLNSSARFILASTANKTSFHPCLTNPPTICYQIYTYTTTVSLPNNENGYTILAQNAFRVNGIVNIASSSSTGITITATIPGVINNILYRQNASPFFVFKDTAVICLSSSINYQFEATDSDGDSLSYEFGNGLNGTSSLSAPPHQSLTYVSPYSGKNPLGNGVTIDAKTGLITGTLPNITGQFIIAVYVKEWRNGVHFNTTKKELQVAVANCSLTSATLNPVYLNCSTKTFVFQNESISPGVTSYKWFFNDSSPNGATSSLPTPSYTYPDTGTYKLKLIVQNAVGCTDSAFSNVKVYPDFTPKFNVVGGCIQMPFTFSDSSKITGGSLVKRIWNFGDGNTLSDSANSTASYLYTQSGTFKASIRVTSSEGCDSTFSSDVIVFDKPALSVPFTDTLICSIDSLALIANTIGSITWTPNYNIINPTTNNPIVYPKDTTTYKILVNDRGCVDSTTVTVNVLQFISVKFTTDEKLCATDTIQLKPISEALSFKWTELNNTQTLSDSNSKNPNAFPLQTTLYKLNANLGKCQDSAFITVFVSPIPTLAVSADTAICIGGKVFLVANSNAHVFRWNNTSLMLNANTLTPVVAPSRTTTYTITAFDTAYCDRVLTDSIKVTVFPMPTVSLGSDTSVVVGQPLQLRAISNYDTISYQWTPSLWLNNSTIQNPVATIFSTMQDSIIYKATLTNQIGCSTAETITIKVFKTAPDIFVPSAFSPNNDGLNDVLKPIPVGIKTFKYFNIYDRYGALIFTTNQIGKGWNGMYKGSVPTSGTFVYTTEGVDFLGNTVFRKGVTVIIR